MNTPDRPERENCAALREDVLCDLQLLSADSVAPQAWRNGGGQTRELLAWPAGPDWRVRISRADIAADGPFSAFPQVERWFTVLQGAGVLLTFAGTQHRLAPGDAPLRFDGAAAPGCRLLDGPTQDLNLMLRRGAGAMLPVQAGQGWDAPCAMRGLYTTVAGLWCGGRQSRAVAAHTLLWMQDGARGVWSFQPAQRSSVSVAWWLGFTPADDKPVTVRPEAVVGFGDPSTGA